MDIKQLILAKIEQNRKVEASEIIKATKKSRAYINRFFQELRDEGKIVKLGRTKGSVYVLADKQALTEAISAILTFRQTLNNVNLREDDVLQKIKKETGIFSGLKENVAGIVSYAFLEILNNAIEHSRTEKIKVAMKLDKSENKLEFTVMDNGIGIFNNIQKTFGLPDVLSAIQHLLKGKQTTAPKTHSGQGIFFVSKMAESFVISSFGKCLIFNNRLNDIFIEDRGKDSGTRVSFFISLDTKLTNKEIFDKYTGEWGDYAFDKTEILVRLYNFGGELLSRSEARRIVTGLGSFSKIILDFAKVNSVGQGFADEIFRVWKNNNPDIKIEWKNANDNVEFMIKRALVAL